MCKFAYRLCKNYVYINWQLQFRANTSYRERRTISWCLVAFVLPKLL